MPDSNIAPAASASSPSPPAAAAETPQPSRARPWRLLDALRWIATGAQIVAKGQRAWLTLTPLAVLSMIVASIPVLAAPWLHGFLAAWLLHECRAVSLGRQASASRLFTALGQRPLAARGGSRADGNAVVAPLGQERGRGLPALCLGVGLRVGASALLLWAPLRLLVSMLVEHPSWLTHRPVAFLVIGITLAVLGLLAGAFVYLGSWFIEPLVVFGGRSGWAAFGESLAVTARRLPTFVFYGFVFALLASLPMLWALGLDLAGVHESFCTLVVVLAIPWSFALIPLFYGSLYAAYVDLFERGVER